MNFKIIDSMIKIILGAALLLQSVISFALPGVPPECSKSVKSPYVTDGYMLDKNNKIVIKYSNELKVYEPRHKYLPKGGMYANQDYEILLTNTQFNKLGLESITFNLNVHNNYEYIERKGRSQVYNYKFDINNQSITISDNNWLDLNVRWPKGDKVTLQINNKYFEAEINDKGNVRFRDIYHHGFGLEYWKFVESFMLPKPDQMLIIYRGRKFNIGDQIGGNKYFQKIYKDDNWYLSVLSELNLLKMVKAYVEEWCIPDF